jgi:hypothetical protein
MNSKMVDVFERLAHQNSSEIMTRISSLGHVARRGLLIEVCRALDMSQVEHVFAKRSSTPYPDVDLMERGWNATFAALFTNDFHEQGIPIQASTAETLGAARSLLYKMGLSALLLKTASMMKSGMVVATQESDAIRVRSIDFSAQWMDQIEVDKLSKLEKEMWDHDTPARLSPEEIGEKMSSLVFPFDTPYGRMVGYDADPALDSHFIALVVDIVQDWQVHAGIHPDTDVGGISGQLLTGIVLLLAAIYLKHIHFIAEGNRVMPKVNYAMSLTIWKPRQDLVASLTEFTGVSEQAVNAVLDRIIATPSQAALFSTASTPNVPLLIQVSGLYLLSPVSGIFRNPMNGIRTVLERTVPNAEDTIRKPREAWMKSELDNLFRGLRYEVIVRPVMLKRKGNQLTDIDAAVLDLTSGCLALFQLKWQDFGNFDVKRQRSQAKNFVTSIEQWADAIHMWLMEQTLDDLAKALQLKGKILSLRLFAIGKFAARFKSHGFAVTSMGLAACSWPQFVRLRWEIGSVPEVLGKLHEQILAEVEGQVEVQAIPHEVHVCGQKIILENTWNNYDNGDTNDGKDE